VRRSGSRGEVGCSHAGAEPGGGVRRRAAALALSGDERGGVRLGFF
jgi:hypothetical protein